MSYLLYQIMVYTCEDFWPGQLAVSKLSGDYFDETGTLPSTYPSQTLLMFLHDTVIHIPSFRKSQSPPAYVQLPI